MARKAVIALIVCILTGLPILTCATLTKQSLANDEDFNFGTVSIDSEVRHSFIISHKSSETLHITNAYCSSNCIHILSYPQKIPPLKNGQLEVRMIPSEAGEVAYEIILETGNSSISTSTLRYGLMGVVEGKMKSKEKKQGQIEIPDKFITRKLRERNPAFAISVESVLEKLQENQEIILIDIRSREEFQKFSIPGAINIPLFSIKTKTLLKSKYLVLINEGYSYSQLEQECARLRDAGFRVSILNGGLNSWSQQGAPLEGDVFAQKELNKITPQIFFTEKDYSNWLLVDGTRFKKAQARYLIPQGFHIPLADGPEQFVSKLKAITYNHTDTPFLSILIFDDNGRSYEEIEKLFQKAEIKNIFYLKDGVEGYKAFLEQQASIWQDKNKTRKSIKAGRKCASCP